MGNPTLRPHILQSLMIDSWSCGEEKMVKGKSGKSGDGVNDGKRRLKDVLIPASLLRALFLLACLLCQVARLGKSELYPEKGR